MRAALAIFCIFSTIALEASERLPIKGSDSPNGSYRLFIQGPSSIDESPLLELVDTKTNVVRSTLPLSSYAIFPFIADSDNTIFLWSPDSKHLAVMIRGTKRTWRTSVYSVEPRFHHILVPDVTAYALKSINKKDIFRHFRETPVRWLDGNRLVLLLEGDCGVPPDVLSYRGEVVVSLDSRTISGTKHFVTEKEKR
jgi:hypothetical protein